MSNPNPMHSRCGLEDCDCEYTIGKLVKTLEAIRGKPTLAQTSSIVKDALAEARRGRLTTRPHDALVDGCCGMDGHLLCCSSGQEQLGIDTERGR